MVDVADASMTNMAMNPSANGDETLLVKFEVKATKNEAKSKTEGREIFEDIDWIEISQPGNKLTMVGRPVRETDKSRFPRHWAAYKNRKDESGEDYIEGTPLAEWAGVSRSQVEELRFLNVRTVEQLSTLADVNTTRMIGLMTLKQKAQKFIASSNEQAGIQAVKRAEEVEGELAELKAQMAELMANNVPHGTSEKPKRKRRTKAEMEAAKADPESETA